MLNHLYTDILTTTGYAIVLVQLVLAFSTLYLSMATSFYLFGKFSNKKGWTEPVISTPLFDKQIKSEILNSISSILVFALYGVFTIWLFRNNYLEISFENNWMIIVDIIILAVWNEFHFFAGHRIMHTNMLLPFHRIHHKSVVVTPFSTYSFHPLESIIMGTVMIIPLLFYSFEIMALIIFPIYHLFFNTVGHCNFAFKNRKNPISSQHNDHHTKFNLNFGFITHRLGNLFKNKFRV